MLEELKTKQNKNNWDKKHRRRRGFYNSSGIDTAGRV